MGWVFVVGEGESWDLDVERGGRGKGGEGLVTEEPSGLWEGQGQPWLLPSVHSVGLLCPLQIGPLDYGPSSFYPQASRLFSLCLK